MTSYTNVKSDIKSGRRCIMASIGHAVDICIRYNTIASQLPKDDNIIGWLLHNVVSRTIND